MDIAEDVKGGIPADIRDTVRRMLEYGEQDRMFVAVASAILAERERAAKLADKYEGWESNPADIIADEIRSGER